MHAYIIEVFKITHGHSSVTLDTFFEIVSTNKTRGHTWKLKKKRLQFFFDCIITHTHTHTHTLT